MEETARQADRLMGQQRWNEAEALLLDGLSAASESGQRGKELSFCSELLGFYRMRGDEARFFRIWERTGELLGSVPVPAAARGTILINGATGMVAFGRARDALPYYEEALQCYRRALPRGDVRFASLYNNLASAYMSAGDFPRAESEYRRAREVLNAYPDNPDRGTCLVNLAQLYASADCADPRVGDCLDRAMEVFDSTDMIWNAYYAHTVRKCAGAFRELGRPLQGKELEERAALIYEGT